MEKSRSGHCFAERIARLPAPEKFTPALPCPRPARESLARVARPVLSSRSIRRKTAAAASFSPLFAGLGFRGVGGLAAQPCSDGASYQDGEEDHDAAGHEGHEGSQGSEDGHRGEEEMEEGAQLCDLPQA